MYIHYIAVLIEGSENLELEQKIDDDVENLLFGQKAAFVSVANEELVGDNYGRCVKCGTWASDKTKENKVRSFSNGAKIEGNWYCDLCLSKDHPNSF